MSKTTGGITTTITIVQAANVWTARTPGSGTEGAAYTYIFVATGATANSYALDSGTLPTGLTLANTGILSGTPTVVGTSTFAVTATVGATVSTGNVTVVVSAAEVTKLTICHRTRATTNPYVLITVSVNSVIGSGGGNGHRDHNTTSTNLVNPISGSPTYSGSGPYQSLATYASNRKWWGDIIPPFNYATGQSFAGLNWAPEWPTPSSTAQSGSAGNWITSTNFGTATTLSTADTNYSTAVALCKGVAGTSAVPSAQALYNLNVNAGVPASDANSDIDTLDVGLDPYSSTTPQAAVPTSSILVAGFTAEVTTVAASSVAQTQAQLNGTLALTTPTSANFEYGTDPDGTLTTTTPVSSPSTPTSAVVTGLTCGTTYYFRVVGTNSSGTYWGQFLSFATSACSSGGGGSSGGGTTTTTTTTTTTATTTTPTTTPATSPGVGPVKKPETEKVKPGRDITLIEGEPTKTVTNKIEKSTKVEVSGPEFKVEIGGTTPAGTPLPLTPGGAPIVAPKEKVATSGDGYAPGTSIELYILNPLTSLGSIPVNPDGSFSGSVTGPPTLPPGEYVIQMNGYTPTSQVRSVSVGISVRSAALTLCSEGTAAKSSSACPGIPQRPRKGFILPDELLGGRNLLMPTRVRMNSGVFADVQVLCSPVMRSAPMGDVAYCETTRVGKRTYVLIRPGMPLSARVVISAPATGKYAACTFTKRYTVK